MELKGGVHRSSTVNAFTRTRILRTKILFFITVFADSSNLTRILKELKPDEVYNLGAQSHVAIGFESPEYTADVDALGTLRMLEAIVNLAWKRVLSFIRLPHLGYGEVKEIPQTETIYASSITLCCCKNVCLLGCW